MDDGRSTVLHVVSWKMAFGGLKGCPRYMRSFASNEPIGTIYPFLLQSPKVTLSFRGGVFKMKPIGWTATEQCYRQNAIAGECMNSPKKPSSPVQNTQAPKPEVSILSDQVSACWCGDSCFALFGPDYLNCLSCGTLVSQKGLSTSELQVVDDEHDFYGRQYWLDHQQQDLDLPSFEARTRSDLPERNLHWLRALLKYKLPPSEVMELGCAHGSFVALMQQAGYVAFGVEMSPWVVEYGRKTFGIDVRRGPVEALDISPGSLDVIAMMDVMEHLPDPVATMSHCLSLLKPDGLLLVQMPNFEESMNYEELVKAKSSFLEQLKSDEHLYLYSRRSTIEFFQRLGADHIQFEPAIFAHYDMFFAVSRAPLHVNSPKQIEMSLQASPGGRIALALLDMKERYDHAPGLQAEIASNAQLQRKLYERVDELKNEQNLVEAKLADLQRNFDAVEVDRVARGEVIQAQGHTISGLQAQVHQRLGELNALYPQLDESARVLQDVRRALTERDTLVESAQQQLALHERAAEAATIEAQRLQDALVKSVLEVENLRDSLAEREQSYQQDVGRREAEMQTLRGRWWWKLGKLIKAL